MGASEDKSFVAAVSQMWFGSDSPTALSFSHLLFCLKEELEKRLSLQIHPSACSRARVNVCFCWRSLWCLRAHTLTLTPVFVIVQGKFLGCLVSETYSDQMKRTEFP